MNDVKASRIRIIVAMITCYFLFAILLNSVGTVILQAIHTMNVSKPQAASLEGFKDLPIALVSFFVASFIPRIGYKVALILALTATLAASLMMPTIGTFWMLKLLFATIGGAFALVKVSVYALVGQVTDNAQQHSSLFSFVEGMFMVGVLSGYWFFAWFIDPQSPMAWLNVYYLLGAFALFTLLVVLQAPIQKVEVNESHHQGGSLHEFLSMIKLCAQSLVLIFVISTFLYVLIEQSIGTWLPTFNNEVLHMPVDISVQLTSIFAASLAVGRLLAGTILRYIGWYTLVNINLVMMAALVVLTLPLTAAYEPQEVSSIFDVPFAALLMPLIGLFMAPIYPILNSAMLSSLPSHQHAKMTGLIVVFSALGGTFGSLITGMLFAKLGGVNAFYSALVPISLIAIALFFFNKRTKLIQASAAA
ncbi:MFS transporter [Pseudoalteromonas sp. SSDWG2]|uniref:MFS transporter n=1 Tax=Pseudoalteromonas sp. SSDWG2 TaxID=3139391 RepID=UPI003BA8AFDC